MMSKKNMGWPFYAAVHSVQVCFCINTEFVLMYFFLPLGEWGDSNLCLSLAPCHQQPKSFSQLSPTLWELILVEVQPLLKCSQSAVGYKRYPTDGPWSKDFVKFVTTMIDIITQYCMMGVSPQLSGTPFIDRDWLRFWQGKVKYSSFLSAGCNHSMMTSSNGNTFPLLALCAGGIHQSLMNSLHTGQWHGALMFSLICAWISGRANKREAGDLRHYAVNWCVSRWNGRDTMDVIIFFISRPGWLTHEKV